MIFRYISRYPGSYFREIQKGVDLATGVLEYHLNYRVKKGLLSTETERKRKRYYVSEEIPHPDKRTIGLMRQKMPRRITIHAMLNPDCSFQDLRKEFEIAKSTLSFHLKKLEDAGILVSYLEGRKKFYKVADPEETARILISYKSSFLDAVLDSFAEVWLEVGK
ncbi:MAG: helix-turn-helix domain-containing protein [Methanobacteriota archaeon]|nr:MAG: helix-turn-helix domain-containing protein [Euryarchaeota archaeon]